MWGLLAVVALIIPHLRLTKCPAFLGCLCDNFCLSKFFTFLGRVFSFLGRCYKSFPFSGTPSLLYIIDAGGTLVTTSTGADTGSSNIHFLKPHVVMNCTLKCNTPIKFAFILDPVQ